MELDGCNHRSESGQCVCDVSSGGLTRARARIERAAAASAHRGGNLADADESALLVANDEYSDSCTDTADIGSYDSTIADAHTCAKPSAH